MTIKAVLIDDEELARQGIRHLLERYDDVQIIGECDNGEKALSLISTLKPDVVFLDIQMPQRNGMNVAEKLKDNLLPLIIFLTAHEEFAVDAFDTKAVDYLLKPVRPARLLRSIERVREILALQPQTDELPARISEPNLKGPKRKLLVKAKEKITPIDVNAITTIDAAGNYAVVHTSNERFILRESLSSLIASLPPDQFVRINRSMIINLNQVVELKSAGSGSYMILLKDGRLSALTIQLREMEKLLQFSG